MVQIPPGAINPYLTSILFILGSILFWFGYRHWLAYLIFVGISGWLLLHYKSAWSWAALNLGLLYSMIIGYLLASSAFTALPKGSVLAEGKVMGVVSSQQTPTQFEYSVNKLNKVRSEPIKLKVTCEHICSEVKGGQYWRLLLSLKAPTATYNPHSFDTERWLMSQGIQGYGYVKPSQRNTLLAHSSHHLSYRQFIYEQIVDTFSEPQTSASLAALLIGYRTDLSSLQRDRLREAGLSHLIAISGLHVSLAMFPGMLLGSLAWVIFGSRLKYRKQLIQVVLGLSTATTYALLSGFEPPAQRALFMLLMIAVLSLRDIYASGYQRLAVAIMIMLILEPKSMIDMSFWLTVVVTGVILFGLEVKAQNRMNSLIYLQLLLCTVISAFQLWLFSEYSLTSFIQNLWAIPFISFLIIPIGFLWLTLKGLNSLTNYIGPIAAAIATSLDFIVYLFWYALEVIDQLKKEHFNSVLVWRSYLSLVHVVLLMMVLIAIWLTGLRYKLVHAVVLIGVLLNNSPKREGLVLTAFDVGQGTAIAIEVDNNLMLYDSGYRHNDWVKIAGVLPAWLLANGYEDIDYYIESHSDIDHSGGTDWLLSNYRVDTVLQSHSHLSAKANFLERPQCRPNMSYNLGQAKITILSPPQNNQWSDNDRSCVVLINYSEVKILLTGDIENRGEQWLVDNYPSLTVDIVLVPHHGSKTSSSWSLLNVLKPNVAINTSGYRNRFNFPHDEVVNRYKQMGSDFYDTSTHGQVRLFISESAEINIQPSRQQNPALWRRN